MRALAVTVFVAFSLLACTDEKATGVDPRDGATTSDGGSDTAFAAGDGGTSGWVEMPADGPQPQGAFLVASLGDRLLAVGNRGSESTSETWEYAPTGSTWKWTKATTTKNPPNFARYAGTWGRGAALAGRGGLSGRSVSALLLGGATAAGATNCLHEAWSYSESTHDWTSVTPPDESGGRGFLGTRLALIPGGALAIGGSKCSDDNGRKEAWQFDGSTWTKVTSVPCGTLAIAYGYNGSPLHAENATAPSALLISTDSTGTSTYRWNGSACDPIPSAPAPTGYSQTVFAAMTHDGSDLYFRNDVNTFRWTGSSWQSVGKAPAGCTKMSNLGAIAKGRLAMLCEATDGATKTYEFHAK